MTGRMVVSVSRFQKYIGIDYSGAQTLMTFSATGPQMTIILMLISFVAAAWENSGAAAHPGFD